MKRTVLLRFVAVRRRHRRADRVDRRPDRRRRPRRPLRADRLLRRRRRPPRRRRREAGRRRRRRGHRRRRSSTGRAVVDFEVDEDVAVPTDTTVEVRWRNLIGQRYLSIVPGTAPTLLGDGDTVENAANVVDLGQLVNQLAPLARVGVARPAQPHPHRRCSRRSRATTATFDGLAARPRRGARHRWPSATTPSARCSGLRRHHRRRSPAATSRSRRWSPNLVGISATFADNDALLDRRPRRAGRLRHGLDALPGRQRPTTSARVLDHLAVLTGTAADDSTSSRRRSRACPACSRPCCPTVNRGEWLRVNVLCLTPQHRAVPVPDLAQRPDGGLQITSRRRADAPPAPRTSRRSATSNQVIVGRRSGSSAVAASSPASFAYGTLGITTTATELSAVFAEHRRHRDGRRGPGGRRRRWAQVTGVHPDFERRAGDPHLRGRRRASSSARRPTPRSPPPRCSAATTCASPGPVEEPFLEDLPADDARPAHPARAHPRPRCR